MRWGEFVSISFARCMNGGKGHNGCMSRTSLQSKEKRKKERKRKYVSMCRRASVAVETEMYCIVYVCVYIYI